nr:hypothetical protein [Tanacetum cinerariifolium]
MRMEQYLTFTDHALWEVIINGDSVSLVASTSAGAECPIPPKTAKQKLARKNELKAKSTLMLAIPDEHLLKFHAIKNRFGGKHAIETKWVYRNKKDERGIVVRNKARLVAQENPIVSEGFEEIIHFLNVNSIKYALTVNPTVYTCALNSSGLLPRFEDEGGVDCVSNEVIFEQLTLMGIMASVIICLATNKNFNFSNYIFDNMVKHLDGGVKFLMYPRFVQVFVDNQVKGLDRHNAIFVISSHTKKVFANMRRKGKDFSRKKQKSRRKQRKGIEVSSPSSEIPNEEGVPKTSNDPLASEAKTAQAKEIASLNKRVKKLEQKRKSRTSGLKRFRKVGSARRVESSTKASLGDHEDASKQERMIDKIDQDVEITLVDDTQGRMNEGDMFGVNDLDGDEVVVDVSASKKVEQSVKVVEKEVSTADLVTTTGEVVTTAGIKVNTAATTPQIYKDELTLAQTLIEIKVAKPKAVTTVA